MMEPSYSNEDFGHSPFVVFYEITRACDLVCRHCRASASPRSHPQELTPAQSIALLDQLAQFPKPPLLVLSGGDPMKRADIYDVISHGRSLGLNVGITPSATPLLDEAAVRRLRDSGIGRLAMSIDGAEAATHDSLRGVDGSFERTLHIMRIAREAGLQLQINTTITTRNVHQVDAIADLLQDIGIVLWSVFFLIPVGRGTAEHRVTADECEQVFEALWRNAATRPFSIKTTEAHHYRRFVLQRRGDPQRDPGHASSGERIQRAPLGVNDGKGVMFVSHIGEIYPSGFMPVLCGRFPADSVVKVYQENDLFRALRNPDGFGGKCGVCEFRRVCGGSRARAYAVHGDPLGPEPDCAHIPRGWSVKAE